jgi:signal transduction histidine kinase
MTLETSWKIVVMDDEPDILEVISIVLQDQGYQVVTAANGREGLELCARMRPQIVLTDVRMPEMDGLEVLAALKESFDDMEVVVMTAFGELEYAVKALHLDASDFITKPVDDVTLHLALKRARERYTSRKKLKEYTAFLEQANITQAKLLHRDKMISLGRLSAGVVHEINNPLAGILNYARLMNRILEKGALDGERQEKFSRYLTLMESESHRISQIVSSLLTFSRKSEPTRGPVFVADLIYKCILLSQHRMVLGNIELHRDIPPDIPTIQGDANQLQQCLINVIFNAMDAMDQGGRMDISAGYDTLEKTVFIQVKDTGHGITPKNRQRIFEPFFTTKDEGYGVGLGLSILFGIMEAHGGSVGVESTPGKGTAFTLHLPVTKAKGN